MSEAAQGVALVRRVVSEHRRAVYLLAAALVANVVVFVALVYPLRSAVANVEQRTRDAEAALASAQADYGRTSGTLTGKDRAVKELETFYTSVLARDLPAARRLTYPRLVRLAEETNLDYERSSYEPEIERGSNLTRLRVTMNVAGSYADVRDFIHEIEVSPEFIVIESVSLAEGLAGDDTIRLTLQLSTYFRNAQP